MNEDEMKLIKVAAAVVNQTPLAWDGNRDNILAALEAARREGVSVVCFPELCISGYGCEDAFHGPSVPEMAWRVLREILPATQGMIVSVGLPVSYRNALFNCACMISDARILGFTAKRFLAGDGLHYEPRWFKPWPLDTRGEVELDGVAYPIGDLHYTFADGDFGSVGIGFEICEDAWVAARPGSALARRGVDIILNPSASHFAFDKVDVRRRFVLEGSRAFGVSYVYSNLLGNEAGRVIYDGGAMIASNARLIAEGPRFSFADWQLTTAVVDVSITRTAQSRTGSFTPAFGDAGHLSVHAEFTFPHREPELASYTLPAWETSPHRKEEEFSRAVPLALFDYLRKSRSHGFVVSLSGGADSAAVSCLVAYAVALGVAELGMDGFRAKLGYIRGLEDAADVRALVERLLLCAYQATENSGPVTREAARAVARGTGAGYVELDVTELVRGYVTMIEEAVGRELSWERDDLTLQNIQARVRAPSVWMLANLRNALLLSTSNRSEAAVGYATMDGDTAGGLAPVAGIDKAFLRRWLRWVEEPGPGGLHPIPELHAVNAQAPTAELRPSERAQTDEADLMPYPVLDVVERAAIRDRRGPLDVFREVRAAFPEYDPRQLGAWVERFFRLWSRNQWKRERYAPSFHLDDENLDPKTWFRFPILSGGFERELAELRAFVAALPASDLARRSP
jgi:NAD+ synthase (glutamine-hydrolysing)